MSVAASCGVTDRRRDKRFSITEPAEGSLRVFPDVIVQEDSAGQWSGISRQPFAAGDTFVLDVVQVDPVEGEVRRRLNVCVIDSQPVLVDGELCHRIRLYSGVLTSVEFEQQVRRG
jgi:hypothetical protein